MTLLYTPEIPLIGIFTPTYNRAHCLSRCFESLCSQTSNNFEWYIIDDGSDDHTNELVSSWASTPFRINYIYKENGGLHTAYNTALSIIKNPLCMCIDSDDWLPNNSIKTIELIWDKIKNQNYVGIMGLDCYSDGSTVGSAFPNSITSMYLYEKLTRYKIKGDKKLVHRTDLLRKVFPMPVFDNEKYFNPSYLMYQADQFGPLHVINEYLCIVEYQPDGMSSNIWKQYYNSPRSFAETRRLYLGFPNTTLVFKIHHTIHYISSSLLAKKLSLLIKSPYPLITALMLPAGIALSILTLLKAKAGDSN